MPDEKKTGDQQSADQALLKGGPGDGPPGDKGDGAGPKLVPVKYGDKEYQLPEDLAGAWQDREKEFTRKLSEQGEEVGTLRRTKQEYEDLQRRIAPPKQQEPDLSTLMFENPVEYNRRMRAEIRQEVTQDFMRYEGEKEAWNQFRTAHADLDGERELVTFVANKFNGEIMALPQSQRADHLADLTRKEILRVASKFKMEKTEDTDLTDGRAYVESPTGKTPKRPATTDEGPKSLSDVLRARRQGRLRPGAARGG